MTEAEFDSLCAGRGFRKIGSGRYAGTERGWLVALTRAGKKRISLSLPAGGSDKKEYGKALKAALRERLGSNASAAWGEGFITVYITVKDMANPYAEGVVPALEALRNIGFTMPDKCGLCGMGSCDAAVPHGAAFAPVHRRCLENGVAGERRKAEKNVREGSYVTGFIGAVLGMVVGIIPSALTIILAERIYVLLFTLIPIAVYAGYRLLKGKMNYTALVLSVVLSAVGVYLLNYILLVYRIGDYFELGLADTVSLLPSAILDTSVFMEITKSEDFIKCALFATLGIFLAWGQISRTNKHDIKDAQGVLASAIPFGEPVLETESTEESTDVSPEADGGGDGLI